MQNTPNDWRDRQAASEQAAQDLKQKADALALRYRKAPQPGRRLSPLLVGAVVVVVGWVVVSLFVGWGPLTTLRHLAAAPNCDAARFVGLAPAKRGQPGYWASHDRDNDGVSCEPARR